MPKLWITMLGAVLLTSLVSAGGAAARTARPTLSLESTRPLVVVGAHFFAHEWVRVTALSETSRVRAKANGSFVVTFPRLMLDRCTGLVVRAAGTHRTLAERKLPRPACMPARSP